VARRRIRSSDPEDGDERAEQARSARREGLPVTTSKPAVIDEVKAEVKALRKDFLHVCELDEVYNIQ